MNAPKPWYLSSVTWTAVLALLLLVVGILLALRSEFGVTDLPPPLPQEPAAGSAQTSSTGDVPAMDSADFYMRALQAAATGRVSEAGDLLGQAQLLKEIELARIYQTRSDLEWRAGRLEQALKWLQRALFIRPDDPELLTGAGVILYSEGRYSEAEPFYQRAMELRKEIQGPDHMDFATSLNNLGALYVAQGKTAEAIPLYRDALAIVQKKAGPEHPKIATTLSNLAYAYSLHGNAVDARVLYERALAILGKTHGQEHPMTIRIRNNYTALISGENALDMKADEAAPPNPQVR